MSFINVFNLCVVKAFYRPLHNMGEYCDQKWKRPKILNQFYVFKVLKLWFICCDIEINQNKCTKISLC